MRPGEKYLYRFTLLSDIRIRKKVTLKGDTIINISKAMRSLYTLTYAHAYTPTPWCTIFCENKTSTVKSPRGPLTPWAHRVAC